MGSLEFFGVNSLLVRDSLWGLTDRQTRLHTPTLNTYIPTPAGPPLFFPIDLGIQNGPRFSPYSLVASHMGSLESLGPSDLSSVYLVPQYRDHAVYLPTGLPLFSSFTLGIQKGPRFSPYSLVASHMGSLESLGPSVC